jgi:hypothetical protein
MSGGSQYLHSRLGFMLIGAPLFVELSLQDIGTLWRR